MNTFITNEWTQTVSKLIREIVNDPSTYRGAQYLPSIAMEVSEVFTEVVEATGGLTNEHLPGTTPKYVQSGGSRVQSYTPPAYKEAINYDEQKILNLRKLGDNGRNVRGIQQRLDLDIDMLNRRIEARIEKQRWDTIFNGGFTWMGKALSFGIPAGNRAVPVGAVWSSDGVVANAAANPLIDLRYWLMGGLDAFRKYNITKIVMNPTTARWILDNANTRSYVTSFGANPTLGEYTLDKVLALLAPGLPPVDTYNGWYQNQSVDSDGHITVSDAVYFIPNGYIFFECSLPGNDKIGDFVQTLNLASGSIEQPGAGKFIVIDDNTAPGTKGGPANPYLDIVAGVYGGVKLDRAFDVLTAKVIA
jgi:hypothetical protein